jgi:hypothetical protein
MMAATGKSSFPEKTESLGLPGKKLDPRLLLSGRAGDQKKISLVGPQDNRACSWTAPDLHFQV